MNLVQDPERLIAFFGSIASIISILVNIFQAILSRIKKRDAQAILLTAENGFKSILEDSDRALSTHPADRDPLISSIHAHAAEGKIAVMNSLEKQFR